MFFAAPLKKKKKNSLKLIFFPVKSERKCLIESVDKWNVERRTSLTTFHQQPSLLSWTKQHFLLLQVNALKSTKRSLLFVFSSLVLCVHRGYSNNTWHFFWLILGPLVLPTPGNIWWFCPVASSPPPPPCDVTFFIIKM